MNPITRNTDRKPLWNNLLHAAGAICLAASGALLLPQTASAQNASHKSSPAAISEVPNDPEIAANAVLADTFSEMREQVDRHFHKGEYNHIVNLERVIVQGEPNDYHAFEDSAWLLWSMDRTPESVAFLKQGLQANPNTFEFYDELGMHYLTHMKDPVTALTYYEQAVKFKCPFFTWNNLAHCYEKTNQWDKAVKAWETASQYPGDDIARVHLRRAEATLAQRQGQNVSSNRGAGIN